MGAGPGRFWTRSAQQRQFERDRISKKTQKLLTKFSGLATLGRHNSAMITYAENAWHGQVIPLRDI